MSIVSQKKNFWEKLKKPILIMAPMADVTDSVFRQIITEQGRPDVFYTEFVSGVGLIHRSVCEACEIGLQSPDSGYEGLKSRRNDTRQSSSLVRSSRSKSDNIVSNNTPHTHFSVRHKLLPDLEYEENQRPIVAQIFGSDIEAMVGATKLCNDLGFDGVDINMGCPDRGVEKQKSGAAMIKDPKHAQELILAMKDVTDLPISVKTRLAYNNLEDMDEWITSLLETDIAALIVHLRTRKEMSRVEAHWELANKLVELRGNRKTLVIANGDVKDTEEARDKSQKYNLDGIMLGRAVFGNPWLFSDRKRENIPWNERLDVMLKHTKLFEDTYVKSYEAKNEKPFKRFATMRKFYGAYVNGHPNAKQLKEQLMSCENYNEVLQVVESLRN